MKIDIFLYTEATICTKPDDLAVEKIQVEKGSTIENLVKRYQPKLKYTILAALVDNSQVELNYVIDKPCVITFLDKRSPGGHSVYRRSAIFILLKAVDDILGETPVRIYHTINDGIYATVGTETPITAEQVKIINKQMHDIVKRDIPLFKSQLTKKEAMELLAREDHKGKLQMLMDSTNVNRLPVYSCEGFMNFFYGHMVPSTGYIQHFELRKYKDGVLLRLPTQEKPDSLPPFKDESKLYLAFKEAKEWAKLMRIDYVGDLNRMVANGEYKEIIQISEALHEKKTAEIADMITRRKRHIVLIAGPTSSGKTTFARRLCIQLKVNGYNPLYLGTDDYFLDRGKTPVNDKGEYDFESVYAVDIPLFNSQMNALLRGEEVDIPIFDFLEGKKFYGGRVTRLERDQPIVIEGIHGLNKILTEGISDDEKFKIYISPFTQLSVDDHNRVSTTNARLLRRIVRDYQFRGSNAKQTIDRWPDVRQAENRTIFPFNRKADVFFNSAHIYELAILKKYAAPLLADVEQNDDCNPMARLLVRFLRFFSTIEDDSMIPNNSILREFIGGSVFVE